MLEPRLAFTLVARFDVPDASFSPATGTAIGEILSPGDEAQGEEWARDRLWGGLGEWVVGGSPVTVIVGVTPARDDPVAPLPGHVRYELLLTFLDASPTQLEALVHDATATILAVFDALDARRGVADAQGRTAWSLAHGERTWLSLWGRADPRPHGWSTLFDRRLPRGGRARAAWRDPLHPPRGTPGPAATPHVVPPRPALRHEVLLGDAVPAAARAVLAPLEGARRVAGIVLDAPDALALEAASEQFAAVTGALPSRLHLPRGAPGVLFAGVLSEEAGAALAEAGCPAAPAARHKWLRERGLHEAQGTPEIVGLRLATRAVSSDAAACVRRARVERVLTLAALRLRAVGIEPAPRLLVSRV